MSVEQNKAIVQRFVGEAFNAKNLSIGDEMLAGDVVFHTTGGDALVGIESWKQYATIFVTAFPDLDFAVEDAIAEGDKVVLRWMGTGTHKGKLRNLLPTNKTVRFQGIAIYRIEEGKLAELWGQIDMLGLMQQLGAIPS